MRLRYWLSALVVVVLLGVVGQADYEAAEIDSAIYCENVKNGVWPDYGGKFEKYCEDFEKKRLDETNRRI